MVKLAMNTIALKIGMHVDRLFKHLVIIFNNLFNKIISNLKILYSI